LERKRSLHLAEEIAIERKWTVRALFRLLWSGDRARRERRRAFTVLTATSSDDCRDVKLQRPSTIFALCRTALCDDPDIRGEYRKCWIDLEKLLGNNDGKFDENRENFAHTVRNVRIVGTRLVAALRKVNLQWQEDSIDLARLIVCRNGQIRAVRVEREALKAAETSHLIIKDVITLFEDVSRASAKLYTPLSKSEDVIRLCYILPGTWHEGLRYYMVNRSMREAQYQCLSYCWGDATATEAMSINCCEVTSSYAAVCLPLGGTRRSAPP
jgi:hypothetical protein